MNTTISSSHKENSIFEALQRRVNKDRNRVEGTKEGWHSLSHHTLYSIHHQSSSPVLSTPLKEGCYAVAGEKARKPSSNIHRIALWADMVPFSDTRRRLVRIRRGPFPLGLILDTKPGGSSPHT